MNHCIPERVLVPAKAPRYQGLIVTSPLSGAITHYVFRDKDSKLFEMYYDLFQCSNRYLKKTELIRREQFLKFGDNIIFTANERNEIIDYEKSINVYECQLNNEHQLVKSICCLPPSPILLPAEKDQKFDPNYRLKVWTKDFGMLDLSENDEKYCYELAAYDVPIYCWIGIHVDVDGHQGILTPYFYDFFEIAVEDRHIAWEADWNFANKPTTGLTWGTDSDSEGGEFIEKSDEQVYHVRTKLEGIIIGQKEIFSQTLKEHRVYIGLWMDGYAKYGHAKNNDTENAEGAENVTLHQPFGRLVTFDAYYSDIRSCYIAYYCRIDEDLIGDVSVFLQEWNSNPTITTSVNFIHCQGGLYNNVHFGLIADPCNVLQTLPYFFEEIEMEQDTVEVIIRDRGHEHIVRFEITDEIVPKPTTVNIQKANEIAHKEEQEGQGFVVNHLAKRLFSPDFPTLYFQFPDECDINDFPVGSFVEFKWVFADDYQYIVAATILTDYSPLPHSRQRKSNATGTGFEFKIEVDYDKCDSKRYLLFNECYGYVNDPDKRFQSKPGLKKYMVIVEEDQSSTYDELCSIFKLVRMARPKEKMESEMPGGIAAADQKALQIIDNMDLGLDDDDAFEDMYSKNPPSQVEYNSEHSIRTRKKEADKRRKQRKKLEKERKEQEKAIAVKLHELANEGDFVDEVAQLSVVEKKAVIT